MAHLELSRYEISEMLYAMGRQQGTTDWTNFNSQKLGLTNKCQIDTRLEQTADKLIGAQFASEECDEMAQHAVDYLKSCYNMGYLHAVESKAR